MWSVFETRTKLKFMFLTKEGCVGKNLYFASLHLVLFYFISFILIYIHQVP